MKHTLGKKIKDKLAKDAGAVLLPGKVETEMTEWQERDAIGYFVSLAHGGFSIRPLMSNRVVHILEI